MVGPVNGAYTQQAQIANPYQQQQGNRQAELVRQREESQAAEKTEKTEEPGEKRDVQTAAASRQETQQSDSRSGNGRGNVVDITV